LSAAAGCAGFLVRNWPPAKIFMGDVGSAFLGFTFAFITLAAVGQTPQLAIAGAFLLWPFIFDATFTIIRRMMRGENLLIAHRSHIYQRLVLAGWRHSSVTLLYGTLSLVALAFGALWLWSMASARS
jgi:UDP-N-acetylmuramyl pentapeptide phosphotransferase/UDP-N-acetylglucosamine-1-phosphate transferase